MLLHSYLHYVLLITALRVLKVPSCIIFLRERGARTTASSWKLPRPKVAFDVLLYNCMWSVNTELLTVCFTRQQVGRIQERTALEYSWGRQSAVLNQARPQRGALFMLGRVGDMSLVTIPVSCQRSSPRRRHLALWAQRQSEYVRLLWGVRSLKKSKRIISTIRMAS